MSDRITLLLPYRLLRVKHKSPLELSLFSTTFYIKKHCSYLRNMANPNPSCPSPPLNDTDREKCSHDNDNQTFNELRRQKNKHTSDEDFRVVGVRACWGLSFQGSETLLGGRVDDAYGWHLPINAARWPAPDMLRCISQQRHQPHHAPHCKHTRMHQQPWYTTPTAQQLLPNMKSCVHIYSMWKRGGGLFFIYFYYI